MGDAAVVFVQVFPADKRVLAELAAEEAAATNGGVTYTATDEEPDTVDVIGAPHQRLERASSPVGELGGFLKIERSAPRYRDRRAA